MDEQTVWIGKKFVRPRLRPDELLKNKHWKHYLGFSLFFVGLILVAVSSISIFS